METNQKNLAFAFLAGTTIGATLGILYAPKKGSKTRKLIKDTTIETTHEVTEKLRKAKDDFAKATHEKKMEFEERVNDVISNLSNKTNAVIDVLEKKMESLKK